MGIKIKISQDAYDELLNLLKNHEEYTHLRFEKGSCCNTISVMLDVKKNLDMEDSVDDIKILYSKDFYNIYKEVTLVYRNNSFMIKGIHRENTCPCHK